MMSVNSTTDATPHPKLWHAAFIFFVLMIFGIHIVDATLSYLAPVIIERSVSNFTLMGLIMAFSSIVGITSDILLSKWFPDKTLRFFSRLLFSTIIFFPLAISFGQHIPGYLFAMAIWGIYFEALTFMKYHGIHHLVHTKYHGVAWGVLESLHNLALAAGPLVGSRLLHFPEVTMFGVLALLCILAFGMYLFFELIDGKKRHHVVKIEAEHHMSFATQLKVWRTYERVLWPLLGLLVMVFLVEAAFFSIGPVFAEELGKTNNLGEIFVSLYSLPGIFMGLFISVLSKPFGKKRLAFAAGVVGGTGLVIVGLAPTFTLTLFGVLLTGMGIGLVNPTMAAVFEDYLARLKQNSNLLISFVSMCLGIGYSVGPIVNGFLADRIGPKLVFSLWGGALIIYSLLLFVIVKRKIRLPQHELAEIMEENN